MKVRDEGSRDLPHLDAGLRGAADHAGAAIDDIDAVARDDRGRWAHAVGQWIRIPRAEQDDASVLRRQYGSADEDGEQKLHLRRKRKYKLTPQGWSP